MRLKVSIGLVTVCSSLLFAIDINDLKKIEGVNPTPTELNNYILKKSKATNIPPIIVKAILLKEGLSNHKWKQYSPESGYGHNTIVYHHDYANSYGLGLFQITRNLNSVDENEVREIVSNWKYNVDKAYEALNSKWLKNIHGMHGADTNPLIIENWYYPIAWYNGSGVAAKNYVDYVYSYMRYNYRVEEALSGSDNFSKILSKYKFIPELSDPYIIDTFNIDSISSFPRGNAVYTLKQIVESGGKLHIWNKASNSYNEYTLENTNANNINTNIKPNLQKNGVYTYSSNPFYPTYKEQCTAFVWGRVKEKLGIELKFTDSNGRELTSGRDAKNWLDIINNFPHDKVIKGNSIVVWSGDQYNGHGHVAFIEKIENGMVYYNEANWETFKKGGGYDGYVKKKPLSFFTSYHKYAGTVKGYIHLKNINQGSIFDGAGSLISSKDNCWGCNKDQANMHPHKIGSTVVFQWKYKSDTCTHIDIHANRDIGEVIIKNKEWNEHITQKAYKYTNLPIGKYNEKKGVSVESIGDDDILTWNTTSVTTTKPISKKTEIYAYCRTYNDGFNFYDREISNKSLIDVTNGYYWTGTGSIISKVSSRKGFGVNKDWAVAFNTKKSLTSFQWFSSDSCKQIKIYKRDPKSNNTYSVNNASVSVKKWYEDMDGWKKECSMLPCKITRNPNMYYIIKIKTEANAIGASNMIEAKCVE